jgi:hypothetical protein
MEKIPLLTNITQGCQGNVSCCCGRVADHTATLNGERVPICSVCAENAQEAQAQARHRRSVLEVVENHEKFVQGEEGAPDD